MTRVFFLITAVFLLFYSPAALLGQNKEPQANDFIKRDPFIPLVDESGNIRRAFNRPKFEELPSKISFSGICRVKGIFYAIIEGEMLKEGDMLNELKVEQIFPDRVILSLGNKKFELTLEPKK